VIQINDFGKQTMSCTDWLSDLTGRIGTMTPVDGNGNERGQLSGAMHIHGVL
jgi:hypothetical protein